VVKLGENVSSATIVVEPRHSGDQGLIAVPSNLSGGAKPHKKSNAPKTAQQCLESISNMFAFDWTLKDIANLKHNPCKLKCFLKELTM
jgi:hypothetical protein